MELWVSLVGHLVKWCVVLIEGSENIPDWANYPHVLREWAWKLRAPSRWAALRVWLVLMLEWEIHEVTESAEFGQSPIASSSVRYVMGDPGSVLVPPSPPPAAPAPVDPQLVSRLCDRMESRGSTVEEFSVMMIPERVRS